MSKPTLAVWKFASCDGCQLTLLDCEDELLALADMVTIAHFLEASSAVQPGPYDVSLVEGSVTTAAGRGADPPDPRAVTDAGDDRRLRDRRRDPGAAQLRRRGRVRLGRVRQPGTTSTRSPPPRRSRPTSRSTSSCAAAPSTGGSCWRC